MTSMHPDEFTSRLLRAARAERPDPAARARALAAASLGAAGTATAGGIVSKVTLTTKLSLWVSAIALVGASVVAVVAASRATPDLPSLDQDEARGVDVSGEDRTVVPLVPRFTRSVEGPVLARTVRPPSKRVVMAVPSSVPAIESRESRPTELALVRSAKRALALREPADALAVLKEHADLYPKGALDEEAKALRVIALVELGEPSARAHAERFASTYPDSPYAQRVASAVARLPR